MTNPDKTGALDLPEILNALARIRVRLHRPAAEDRSASAKVLAGAWRTFLTGEPKDAGGVFDKLCKAYDFLSFQEIPDPSNLNNGAMQKIGGAPADLFDALAVELKNATERPDFDPVEIAGRLVRFRGVRHEISDIIGRAAPAIEVPFAAMRSMAIDHEEPNQIILAPTYACNLRCSYCFAYEMSEAYFMPDNRFLEFLGWCGRNSLDVLSLTGGEPTLHPRFPWMVEQVKECGLKLYFNTNAVFGRDVLNALTEDVVSLIGIHWPTGRELSEKQLALRDRNVETLFEREIDLICRLNYIPGLEEELTEMVNKACSMPFKSINIAAAFPNEEATNTHVSFEQFRQAAADLLEISKTIVAAGKSVSLAKPVPPCLLVEPEDDDFPFLQIFEPTCRIYQGGYVINAVVGPNFEVRACMVDSDPVTTLNPDEGYNKLGDKLAPLVEPRLLEPIFEQCETCRLFAARRCQGLCLAYKNLTGYNKGAKDLETLP